MIKNINKNAVPIIFSTNKKYVKYMAVAIKSLIENKSCNANIFILHSEDLGEAVVDRILEMQNPSTVIEFVDFNKYISPDLLEDLKLHSTSYFSPETYYRLFIPEIFKDFDKVLYLDCDMIIVDDIAKLYHIDIKDNILGVVTGAITPYYAKTDPEYERYYKEVLNLSAYDRYFQAGVLVFHIKEQIKDNFTQKSLDFLKNIKEPPRLVDQDVLNALYYDRVYYLDWKWNALWHHKFNENAEKLMGKDDFKKYNEAIRNPSIIHYASPIKPWFEPDRLNADYWWKYARMTPFYEELLCECVNKQIEHNSPQINSHKVYNLCGIKIKIRKKA